MPPYLPACWVRSCFAAVCPFFPISGAPRNDDGKHTYKDLCTAVPATESFPRTADKHVRCCLLRSVFCSNFAGYLPICNCTQCRSRCNSIHATMLKVLLPEQLYIMPVCSGLYLKTAAYDSDFQWDILSVILRNKYNKWIDKCRPLTYVTISARPQVRRVCTGAILVVTVENRSLSVCFPHRQGSAATGQRADTRAASHAQSGNWWVRNFWHPTYLGNHCSDVTVKVCQLWRFSCF